VNVRRLVVADHQLLRELAAYVEQLEVPRPPHRELGDWRADIAAGPPDVNRTRPAAFRLQIMEWQQPAWMPRDATIASVNYFPPGGAGLGWHTDFGRPGWRVYIGRPLGPELGQFHFAGGWLEDSPDSAIAFYVSDVRHDSWHAVRCDGPRFSVGLRITGPATARALGLQ
jgi:hypothetical protein